MVFRFKRGGGGGWGILTLLASLCFLTHFFPVPLIYLVPFSSESPLLCSALWPWSGLYKHFSFAMCRCFVSRGQWRATAGGKGPPPGFSVLSETLVLWPLAIRGIWDTQWCSPSREFYQHSVGSFLWVAKAAWQVISCFPALACLREHHTHDPWLHPFQWDLSLSLGSGSRGSSKLVFFHDILSQLEGVAAPSICSFCIVRVLFTPYYLIPYY